MLSLRLLLATVLPTLAVRADSDLTAARTLIKDHKFADARAMLEKIVAAEPRNAAACHEYGLALKTRGDANAQEDALKWLGKSAELEPANPEYLADYGGTLLQLASRTNSLSAATRGRDLMEKAVGLKPDYLEAHEGLFQFYQRAPWPLGSSSKAAAHLDVIRRLDPDRAMVLTVTAKVNAKDYAGAFALCEAVLAKRPDDYVALYNYGRTAALGGSNFEQGLSRLKRCLTMDPPSPASPNHSYVWLRIGTIEEQLHHPAEARAAFEEAVKIDASNKQAVEALARLKRSAG